MMAKLLMDYVPMIPQSTNFLLSQVSASRAKKTYHRAGYGCVFLTMLALTWRCLILSRLKHQGPIKALVASTLLFSSPLLLATERNAPPFSKTVQNKNNIADVSFAQGIKNFNQGRYYAAISDFKRYQQFKPADAKSNDMIGRCYALLGNPKTAKQYFNLAEKDPDLRPKMRRFKKNLELIWNIQEPDGDTPWSFNTALAGGYNSNVIALGNNFALPTDISQQSSQFAEILAHGHYRLMKDDDSSLRILYHFLGDFYESISSMNLQNPFLALEYRRIINSRTNFAFNVSSDNSWLGDARFSSFATAKPSMLFQADAWNTFELYYAYSNTNFFTPVPAVFNRDGFTNILSINDYVSAPNSDLVVRFGYVSNWSKTKGSDFSFQGNDVYIGFKKPFFYKLTLEGIYAYGSYHYDNLNSLANNYSYKRRDNTNRYSLQFQREFTKQLSLYGRYEYFDDNANIAIYSYKQYIISFGLTGNWS